MNLQKTLATLLVFSSAACTKTELDVSANHPANPNAPTAPLPETGASVTPPTEGATDAAHSHTGHSHQAPTPAPMGSGHDHQGHGQSSPSSAPPHAEEKAQPSEGQAEVYTCPMHPEIIRNAPGNCPICGMKLVPKKAAP